MQRLNQENVKCKCNGCVIKLRCPYVSRDEQDAECTFGPWFDNVLLERGLVVLRKAKLDAEQCFGPYNDDSLYICQPITWGFRFIDIDCHLVEMPDRDNPGVRWGGVWIGKRLWDVRNLEGEGIWQFERVFGDSHMQLSSPPTPPSSPGVSPRPPPPQPLPITTTINQGLELKALKEQLAAQSAELQALKENQAAGTLACNNQIGMAEEGGVSDVQVFIHIKKLSPTHQFFNFVCCCRSMPRRHVSCSCTMEESLMSSSSRESLSWRRLKGVLMTGGAILSF
jgi:hypothetical protein